MTIEWRSAMSIDDGVIDADHRHLIDIINQFETFAADGLDLDEALEILFALKFYAATHFKREELLQKLSGFPEVDAHHDEHARLLSSLKHIIDELKESSDDRSLEDIGRETAELLREWLIHHVLESDREMEPYVATMQREAEEMGALADMEPE